MAYDLIFFCRSGEENGSSALARLLSRLADEGRPLLIRRESADCTGFLDEVDACELATDDGSGLPEAGWLYLEFADRPTALQAATAAGVPCGLEYFATDEDGHLIEGG